jgi:hypothetical protein
MQRRTDLVTHHRDKMPAGTLCGVHEVARALELRHHRLVTGDGVGKLRGTRLEYALARLDGTPQAAYMAANGVQALPMDSNAPSQALTLADAGRHAARHAAPEHRKDCNHCVQTN